jgi:hypothetical protein
MNRAIARASSSIVVTAEVACGEEVLFYANSRDALAGRNALRLSSWSGEARRGHVDAALVILPSG